jgi:hypothetical protein
MGTHYYWKSVLVYTAVRTCTRDTYTHCTAVPAGSIDLLLKFILVIDVLHVQLYPKRYGRTCAPYNVMYTQGSTHVHAC